MSAKDKSENLQDSKVVEKTAPSSEPFFTEEKLASLLSKLESDKKPYTALSVEIGNIVDNKNKNYGNSYDNTTNLLKIFYPKGIPPESFSDAIFTIRIFDKLMRIANNKNAYGENPYNDLLGLALRMAILSKNRPSSM